MAFSILTVCTGNVCRSPQAEQLLRAGFAAAHSDSSDWELPTISSAGTHALVGQQMPPEAAALSIEFGGDPSGHSPRQLTREIVEESDLILALAREHRSAVAKLSPAASRRTFTLRELARILASTAQGSVIGLVETPTQNPFEAMLRFAQLNRGRTSGTPDLDDVIDPFGRSEQTYRRSVDQILTPVRTLMESIGQK